jgi:septum formation protein
MVRSNIKDNIILGSKSPRRIELLKLMGFQFETRKLDVDEKYPKNLSPIQIAIFLSKKKAQAHNIETNNILICADTIVYNKNQVLGKPKSKKEAIKMLKYISNKRHFVVTGVTIKTTKTTISFYERSIVYFKKLSKNEIEFYVEKYKPFDKAGSYGIQEWIGLIGIKKISGSYYNIMGLPTVKVYEKLIDLTQ